MATGGVGSLTVTLGLNAAEFVDGLDKAQQQAEKFRAGVIAASAAFGVVFVAAVSKTLGALKDLTVNSIDALDHLNDLASKTGVSATTIGAIGFAASQAGSNLNEISEAATKLNKSLAEATAGNKKAQDGFKALGLGALVAAGNTTTVDQALVAIAGKFEGFADGPNKVAIAMRLLGDAGAKIIPFLNDGSQSLQENIEYYKRFSGVTDETAKRADQFNDTLGKVKLITSSLGTTLASELLPVLQPIADAYLKIKENGELVATVTKAIRVAFQTITVIASDVVFVLYEIVKGMGAVGAAAVKLASLDFSGAKNVFTKYNSDAREARAQLDAFQAKVLQAGKTGEAQAKQTKKPDAPSLPDPQAAAAADQALKKALDAQLKTIMGFAAQQKDAYQFANKYVEGTYTDALESQQQFFDEQKRIRADALQSTLDALDKEAAAIRAAQAKAATPQLRADLNTKLVDVANQRAKAVQDGAQNEVLANQTNERSVRALANAYADLQASIADSQGNQLTAAKLRIDQQVEAARKLAIQAGRPPAEAADQANLYGEQLKGLAELQDAQRKNSQFVALQQNAEASLALTNAANGKSEIATLVEVGQQRQAALVTLQAQADAAQRLATALGTPEAIKFASDLALGLQKAKAELDPLAAQINTGLKDEFADAFSGFLEGKKSALDALRDFGKQVLAQFSSLAAKNLAGQIFGTGTQGGLGSLFSSLASSATSQPSAKQQTAPSSADTASGVTSFLGGIAKLFGFQLATGTNYVPYDGFRATLHKGEAVVPAKFNPAAGGAMPASSGPSITSITNVYPPAQMPRSSSQQIAADNGKAVARAIRRLT